MKETKEQISTFFTKEKCEEMNLHLTDIVLSAFEGKLCKRCLRK